MLWYFIDFTLSLRFTEFRIPDLVTQNSSVQLSCDFDLEGEVLYSLKWYKDDREFYRYTPNEIPQQIVFPVKDVDVDVSFFDADGAQAISSTSSISVSIYL